MEQNDINNDNKNVYELGYLLVPSIAEESVATEVEAIKAVIVKYDSEIISEDFPKLRPLAYQMVKASHGQRNKFDKAYFGWIKFETASNASPQIKTELDKNLSLLRFLIVKTVRENTMVSQKMVPRPLDEEGEEIKPTEEILKVSDEELDKTIETLVVE